MLEPVGRVPLRANRHFDNRLPKEDEVQAALRNFNIPPNDCLLPCPGSAAGMKDSAFVEKYKKGPVLMMTVMPALSWACAAAVRLPWFKRGTG
jgi:hypothetical protein